MFSKTTQYSFLAATLLAALSIACATARQVSVKPGKGGVVAMAPIGNQEARGKAEAIMSQACQGKGYEIIEEGEVVTGSTTSTRQQTNATGQSQVTGFGKKEARASATTTGSATTRQTKEWQIQYACK